VQTTKPATKSDLLEYGRAVMTAFCSQNGVPAPEIYPVPSDQWNVAACAYYRNSCTHICVAKCAAIGVAGPAWSYPGYTVDRTPYGVVQHELGHHVDVLNGSSKGSYWSDFSALLRGRAGEKQITSYCPDDAEWFAEMFRVFVTNPDLLRLVRPRTYRELRQCFAPVFSDNWRERLRDAPARTITAAERQVEKAQAEATLL
jgi:hypothetical protein